MTDHDALGELELLVLKELWDDARELCRALAEREREVGFWKLQLGFVWLLEDKSWDVEWALDCVSALQEAASAMPDDAEAQFWLGFGLFLTECFGIPDRPTVAVEALSRCLEREPEHPYAHLIIADAIGDDEHGSIRHLEKVVELQPGNLRAMQRLFEMAVQAGRRGDAEEWMRRMSVQPFVETRCGLMNDYVNAVLVGGTRAAAILDDCAIQFQANFE